MKTILERASNRGHSHINWADIFYSFSYRNYKDPQRSHFGALEFLNDYTIAIGKSYRIEMDPNMIVVTLPLKGDMHHSDSYGHTENIHWGQVQIINTGTRIVSSEYANHSEHHLLEFLQMGIRPKQMDIPAKQGAFNYQQLMKKHTFATIIAPDNSAPVQIEQDVWLFIGEFCQNDSISYLSKKPNNGIYVMVLSGGTQIGEYELETDDSLAITDTNHIDFKFTKNSTVLLVEVPL